MGEPAGPAAHPLGAIRAKLEQQIPQLYRELALYLQVLRDVLPTSLDQACAHMATQVHPRRYNRLSQRTRHQLHTRLNRLLSSCCSLLTVEQLQSLARQMARERQRLAAREREEPEEEDDEPRGSDGGPPLPLGSIQLQLTPPLSLESPAWPSGLMAPGNQGSRSGALAEGGVDSEDDELPPWAALIAQDLSALTEGASPADSLWADGQLPRDPVLLVHWLEGLEVALQRRLRNLSHGVNTELVRAGLLPAVIPVRLLDSVLTGQIESHGSPANLLRLPLLPHEAGRQLHAPLGVLLRTVDLEMEQPRLRTCRRRLLHHRQEILKMAESFHRLQRRLQIQHAERLWRRDSQLNPPEGI